MADILLTSEKFVKETTGISDNVAGKYVLASIREAQEFAFREVVGDKLLGKLKELVSSREIDAPENEAYKRLLDTAQYFLAYSAVVQIVNKVSYKVGNFGVAKSNDENLQVVSQDEIAKQEYYYQSKADAYCNLLQTWLLDNRKTLPELTQNKCNHIKATLHSAASCGIFLGGARGKDRRLTR